jgi:hypothetical protein
VITSYPAGLRASVSQEVATKLRELAAARGRSPEDLAVELIRATLPDAVGRAAVVRIGIDGPEARYPRLAGDPTDASARHQAQGS